MKYDELIEDPKYTRFERLRVPLIIENSPVLEWPAMQWGGDLELMTNVSKQDFQTKFFVAHTCLHLHIIV